MTARPLRVLLTNHRLKGRGGTQSLVRDLARGLQQRGHSVITYSSSLGQVERVLENDVLPVATDLGGLQERPDIIHGNNHLDLMTALAALPGIPAIYHNHGANWRHFTPQHPRIYRYFVVARTAQERMTAESNLAASDIEVINNFLDTDRFHIVRDAAKQLRRGLFYNSRHEAGSPTLRVIQEATRQCGIDLECAGYYFDRQLEQPELELSRYDLVFASGLSAVEAMGSGCATILLGRNTCGELVTTHNFERILSANFAMAANLPPPRVEAVVAQLQRYSSPDASEVTQRLRRRCDLRAVAERLEKNYYDVLSRHQKTKVDPAAEIDAYGHYLRRLAPIVEQVDVTLDRHWASVSRSESLDALRAEAVRLRKRIDAAERSSRAAGQLTA